MEKGSLKKLTLPGSHGCWPGLPERNEKLMDLTPHQLLNGIRNGRQQGLNDTALDILRKLLVETNPDGSDFGQEWDEILEHALALADEEAALEITRRQIARFPNNGRYPMQMAERLSRVGRSNVALEVIKHLKPRMENNPALDYFLGVYSGHVGQLEESRSHFRTAIQQKPDFGDAWALLGAAGGLTEADVPALTQIISSGTDHALPGAAYALGELYHSMGAAEEAWTNWSLANTTIAARRPYNVKAEIAAHKAIQEADERIWAGQPTAEHKTPRVIFVVGAPRSGTSLIEQIIASSPGVKAMGETMISRLATWPLGNLSAADLEKVGAFGPPGVTWQRLGAVYRHFANNRGENAPVVTDKGALLHMFVGALARMLPNAKFVWVKRDPRDVAFSGFRNYLTDGNRWRHSLDDAATFLKAHDELMQYWKQKFPKQVYELNYASLAGAPQDETDKLTDFLQLPDVDLSRADFSDATVPTASFAQIRGAISPKSVGGWKAYEKWIGPAFQ